MARQPTLQQRLRRYGWAWFGPFLILAGLGGSLLFGLVALEEERYRRDGREAQATVVRRGPRPESRRDRSEVVYRFRTAEGREVEGRQGVTQHWWERLREGQTFRVEYLRQDPASNRMAPDRRDDGQVGGLVFFVIAPAPAIVFGGIGTFFLLSGLRQYRFEQRVRREGMLATATITEVKENTYKSHRYLLVTYRYTDYLGRAHEGRVDEITLGEDAAWKVGDTATIRYDRQRPAASVWIGEG